MAKQVKEKEPLTFEYEKTSFPNARVVCGTDEAGRGPLAGPVYAAAVILDTENTDPELLQKLDDSKKLSEKKRDELELLVKKHALSYCVAYSTVEEIEETDILSASLHAMRKAIDGLFIDRVSSKEILEKLDIAEIGGQEIKPDAVIVDGNQSRDFQLPAKAVIGGDGKSFSIAAASILAKVARDRYCYEVLDTTYPEYAFAKHKGYGTKAHYEAVDKHGLCPQHRKSFFRKYYDAKAKQ
ncbi:MAG: ribonuclease HII [Ruminococcaceae bacterium]|nr:ribonuclease HII [Oscillospiraceae bacterium]